MRANGCALQQALTPDAASVLKQSVLLARRRGHAQVTPLHVANTMLSAASGSFRAACLKSHSHPLQCKALELCFNVALNRLPTSSSSSSSPMLNPHHHHSQYNNTPSISNALVAAFKRAQAHQRRGSVEAQQQTTHLLAVKIDLDQLVISILDDPSVSRVMREAGFSSTQVKANLQISVSNCSPTTTSPSSSSNNKEENSRMFKNEDDVSIVIETLLLGRKRKSLVLVGECVSSLESVVKGLMDKVDKGQVPENLREIKLVTIPPLYTFCNLGREEVEHKVGELTCLVKSVLGSGVVLYLGDFKWISDYRVRLEEEEEERRYYCSVEHVIMEIGRLVWGIGEMERFWLMGIATFQTYMRCRNSSLESVWGLHPVTIPANTLSLGLVSQRDGQIVAVNGEANLLCCGDCSAKFEEEARNLQCNSNGSTLSELPSWLKDESRRLNNQNQNSEAIKKLCMKWNSFCTSAHKQSAPLEKTLTTSTNFFSLDQVRTGSCVSNPTTLKDNQAWTRNLLCMAPDIDGNGFSSTSTTSSSELMEMNYAQKMKEFSAKNLNILCNALEKKFPCHKEIIPEIAGTILQCRSGMLRRKDETRGNNNNDNNAKQETWMLFLGPDPTQAKEKISKELAKVVFGSYSSFLSIGLSSTFVTSSATSDADCRNKRGRDEDNCKSYLERFCQAVSENPHRVFFLEDLEQVDYCSRVGMKRAIEGGKISNQDGDDFFFRDAVVVLSCESLKCMSASRPCSPRRDSGNGAREAGEEDQSACVSLDLNISFHGVEDRVVDEFRIFENVDRRVVFKIQDK